MTVALSSSDKSVSVMMREKMKQYQLFLANFEVSLMIFFHIFFSLYIYIYIVWLKLIVFEVIR